MLETDKINIENKIFIQALYGDQWDDVEEAYNLNNANEIFNVLKTARPNGTFRKIIRTINEKTI